MKNFSIGLVEMANPDLLNIYSFVSKIPRGVPLLAAELIREGFSDIDCFIESIQRFKMWELMRYDIIGFGIITCTADPTYAMIRKLRENGYRGIIIVGGPHATALPEESLAVGADIVVRHEGDKTLPQLALALERKENWKAVLGISFTQNDQVQNNPDQPFLTEEELSALPLPAFRTIRGYRKMRQIALTFSRGCPHKCEFCAVEAMFGPIYRFTSVESRLRMLFQLKTEYPEFWKKAVIFFADDNFHGDFRGKPITREFLIRMPRENLIPPKRWLCQMYVVDGNNEETVELMAKAGSDTVCLGIESANPATLDAFKKRQTMEQIKIGLANFRKYGIKTLVMIIAGADTDTRKSFFQSIKCLNEWHATYLQIVELLPLPETKLTQSLDEEGREYSHNYNLLNGMHVVMKSKLMSIREAWFCLYGGSFWFYFLTPHAFGLIVRHPVSYFVMVSLVIYQAFKWIGERLFAKTSPC